MSVSLMREVSQIPQSTTKFNRYYHLDSISRSVTIDSEALMEQSNTDTKKASVAYVPFASFCTALDYLKTHGTPSKIDGSVFPTFSGGLVSHLLLSMRFLNLIDERGTPTSELAAVVDDQTRKQALAQLLPRAYASLFRQVDLAKASPSELDSALREQGVNGATGRKARAFLLKAAGYAGLPISKYLSKRTRSTGPRKSAARKNKHEAAPAIPETLAPLPRGNSEQDSGTSWQQMLLAKFPNFDPAWTDDVKSKWFEAFDKLMSKGQEGKG
jgi:hypothetical protein